MKLNLTYDADHIYRLLVSCFDFWMSSVTVETEPEVGFFLELKLVTEWAKNYLETFALYYCQRLTTTVILQTRNRLTATVKHCIMHTVCRVLISIVSNDRRETLDMLLDIVGYRLLGIVWKTR